MVDCSRMAPYTPAQTAPAKGMPLWLIVLLAVLGVVLLIVAVLGVLAYVGVRKYVAASKSAEAMVSINQMALDVDHAFAEDATLCDSASSPVPASISAVAGKKYMSTPAEWEVDKGKHAGFDCIKFSMMDPQYYQYDYKRTGPTGFTVFARGDLDGNGVTSEFSKSGRVAGGFLVMDADITQKNPTE
jgi:type IV pilus assembly protein PilA